LISASTSNAAADDDGGDDITHCCKCRQLLTDPRTLPCLDSLCGKCLREVCHSYSDNLAGMAACPRCGDQFNLPNDTQALPDHGFIDTLVALKKIANENMGNANCDTCKLLSVGSEAVAAAEYYCIECRQRMCAFCARPHPVCSSTKNHNVVDLGLDSAQKVLRKIKSYIPACANHKDIYATAHCYQCNVGLCTQCDYMHSSHDMEFLADDTHRRLTGNVKSLRDQLHQQFGSVKEETDCVQKLLNDRCTAVEDAEKQIKDKADEIIALIQKERDDLLNILHSRNDQHISSLAADSTRLSSYVLWHKKALRFAEELLEKGSVEDMLLNYRMLNERVTRLGNMSGKKSTLDVGNMSGKNSTLDVGNCSDVSSASLIDEVCTSLNSQSKSCGVVILLLSVFYCV